MQHFFVSPEQVREEKIYVEGSDVNHMKNVLRMKTGEEVTVSDGDRWLVSARWNLEEEDMAVLEDPGEKRMRCGTSIKESICFRDSQSRTRWN